MLTLVASALTLGALDPRAAPTHLALAGLLARTAVFLDAVEPHWTLVEPDEAGRFERDRPLLQLASVVQDARRVSAWSAAR